MLTTDLGPGGDEDWICAQDSEDAEPDPSGGQVGRKSKKVVKHDKICSDTSFMFGYHCSATNSS